MRLTATAFLIFIVYAFGVLDERVLNVLGPQTLQLQDYWLYFIVTLIAKLHLSIWAPIIAGIAIVAIWYPGVMRFWKRNV